MKNKSWKFAFIIIVAFMCFALMCVFGVQSVQNKAIYLFEAIEQAESDIKVQEKARVDKVYNIADCVKQYEKHEYETLTEIAESMSNEKDSGSATTVINAVTYAYPEIKNSENYQKLMDELATIENVLARYRENYNKSVTKYNNYVKGFPARFFLSWTGYEVQEVKRLNYDAPVDAPQNLFEEEE